MAAAGTNKKLPCSSPISSNPRCNPSTFDGGWRCEAIVLQVSHASPLSLWTHAQLSNACSLQPDVTPGFYGHLWQC